MRFSDKEIDKLKKAVKGRLSEKRFLHTLGVLDVAQKLAIFCEVENVDEIKVAALLHDIAKEITLESQCQLIKTGDFKVSESDFINPAVLHSFAAPTLVKRDFRYFATENVLSAIFNHTVGAPDMSVFDEIIFLADFIEDTRKHDVCVNLRAFVWDNMINGNTESNIKTLHTACIKAIDYTVLNLIENKKHINIRNILTRNSLLSKI